MYEGAAEEELPMLCPSLDRTGWGLENTVVPACKRSCFAFSSSNSPSTSFSIAWSKLRRDVLCLLETGDRGGVVVVVSVSEGGLGERRRCFLCAGFGASSNALSFDSISSSLCFKSLLANSLDWSCVLKVAASIFAPLIAFLS